MLTLHTCSRDFLLPRKFSLEVFLQETMHKVCAPQALRQVSKSRADILVIHCCPLAWKTGLTCRDVMFGWQLLRTFRRQLLPITSGICCLNTGHTELLYGAMLSS